MADHRTMEETRERKHAPRASGSEDRPSRTEESLGKRQSPYAMTESTPLGVMRRFIEDVDRMFEPFGGSGRWSRFGLGRALWGGMSMWPQVETFERDGQFVVRADLPGLKKEDVRVHLENDALTIEGERRHEHEEKGESGYFSERSYGTFHRTIPLPEGIKTDQAKASFRDGVLEVTMPSSAESRPKRGRNIEIH